jgi:parallel beta-helix repeat protein
MMTRRISYVMIMAGIIALLGLSPAIYAQHQWTSLDGPYWAKGIDVAYGMSGNNQDWHRYLIGSDGDERNLYYWGETNPPWQKWDELPSANKLISYKIEDGYGEKAFCTNHNDAVYWTLDGGASWEPVPNSDELPNLQFAALEIDEGTPGAACFVGSMSMENEASVYKGELSGNEWDWNPIGESGLESYDIYDLEYPVTGSGYLVAGTDDGIWRIMPGEDPDWTSVAFEEIDINVVEALDYHDAMWAATGVIDGFRRLYFSPIGLSAPWDDYLEIRPDDVPFDKVVNDIGAIYLTDFFETYQSIYLATEEGLYLLDMVRTDQGADVREYINFQEDNEYFHDSPFRFDKQVTSVDYFQEDIGSLDRQVLVGTLHNVYLITEIRSVTERNIVSITIEEIVEGTFISDVVSLAFPLNGIDVERFSVSNKGLIKWKMKTSGWKLKGLSFASGTSGSMGMDIDTDFGGATDYVLAASRTASGGYIMYSEDGGDTWVDRSYIDHPKINSLNLDPVSDDAFAAGEEESNVWFSDNNGFDWEPEGDFTQPTFNDIYSDPDPERDDYVYAGGYYQTSVRAYIYDGSDWSSMTNGLFVTKINQFAKGGAISWLYAATDGGIYKAKLDVVTPITWSSRTYGIGTPDLGSIVSDKNNPYGFLASSGPGVASPHIWASGDSGRSWIELPLGDIPTNASINRLAASQDENSGFLVGTDMGVFALGNIFRAGTIASNEVWGPGVVIVNGDIIIASGVEVTIQAPCTIYSIYDFDIITDNPGDLDPDKTEIAVFSGGSLSAIGDESNRILFTSSRPANKSAGDWTGLVARLGHDIDLQFCDIEYAAKGVSGIWDGYPIDFNVFNCTFKKMQTAGVELFSASTQNNVTIRESIFEDCGTYGIRIYHDHLPAAMSTEISGNEIIDCDYGIWYSGGSNFGGSKQLNIIDNILTQTTAHTGNYGIYAIKYQGAEYEPVIDIIGDSISYFYDGGIYLNSISSWSTILDNRVKRNKNYGIYLANSSPKIGSSAENYNSFSISKTGMYCDLNSHPKVRWTQIKENTKYGVLIDSNYPCDFGTELEWGNNSIDLRLHLWSGYKDMKNTKILVEVSAERNWWGEAAPDPTEIDGNIDYLPPLDSDPLPFSPKRSVDVTDLPLKFALEQNFPNPFNPTTAISLYFEEPGQASLKIYNLCGQLVKTLIEGRMDSGNHSVVWDGKNENGKEVSSGIYFYVLATDYGKTTKRMTLLR